MANASTLPVVAIVGRPNVGKSTLFNRIIQQRHAIVQKTPGVTRDRIYAEAEWQGRSFLLVDTGGLVPGGEDPFSSAINRQVEAALAEAHVIIFVVDGRQGLLPHDMELAQWLHRQGKPVIVAVNKVDHPSHQDAVQEFYSLGFGHLLGISAEHGSGTGDLLDAVIALFPPGMGEGPEAPEGEAEFHWADDDEDLEDEEGEEPVYDGQEGPAGPIRVAVLGRPNVGKSSLLNRLLGQDRFIVSPIAGTTRDAADVRWTHPDAGEFVFVDTAGMRRRSRIKDSIEYYSTLRALAALRRADLALLVLDARELFTDQDKTIAAEIDRRGRGAIIVVNKWDLAPEDADPDEVREQIYKDAPFFAYAPVVTTSALTGQGVDRLPGLMQAVAAGHRQTISTAALNRVLGEAVFDNQPPAVKGRRLKIRYATQTRRQPPTFTLFVNDPRLADPTYLRYLERRLREAFDLTGTPIRLRLRSSS
ncbi:MAG TPA: ribosome biogenesis GTPase Der [Sphingobacteriaceae bacterium]|nr:ribosome biogenesis GTPase Der [Sphingobacteriaceae bacterium]